MNKSRVKKVIFALAAFLIVIQFMQPKRTNPPVDPSKSIAANLAAPKDVQSILMRACGDCHSNQTAWPWYSHIAPLSWVIVDDVNEGRRHMNFDDWEGRQPPKEDTDRVSDICKEARENGMPPFSYRITHRDVRLTPPELSTLCAWAEGLRSTSRTGSGFHHPHQ